MGNEANSIKLFSWVWFYLSRLHMTAGNSLSLHMLRLWYNQQNFSPWCYPFLMHIHNGLKILPPPSLRWLAFLGHRSLSRRMFSCCETARRAFNWFISWPIHPLVHLPALHLQQTRVQQHFLWDAPPIGALPERGKSLREWGWMEPLTMTKALSDSYLLSPQSGGY